MGGLTTRQLASRQLRRPAPKKGSQLQPGQMLQDRYQIMGTLGVGGFSAVYQARDMRFPTVTKLCAVKEMVNTAPDPQMREVSISLFEREANILATLDHPSIPTVYDYFTEGERSYVVMEFIRGKDLDALASERKELFEESEVLDWAMQLCDVLYYLHGQKPQPVVFRDLKPSNIILDPSNIIHLIDFGIAKVFESAERGTTIGTEGYAPPEQYRGQAGPAGDVYAFGATVHHLLTLKDPRLEPPFSFSERPIHAFNPNVSQPFCDVVMRCLSYNTTDRYPDALALREALQQISLTNQEVVTPPPLTNANSDTTTAPPDTAHLNQHSLNTQAAPTALSKKPPTEPEAPSETGIEPLWTFQCEDEIRSTAAVANGVVFMSAYDNNLYALNASTGKFIWKFPAQDEIASSPYVHGDAVFFGSADNRLYAVNQRSGQSLWFYETDGPVYSSPRVDFDHVFFGSDDGYLYATNANNGRLAWKTQAHSPVRSSPCISGEMVYFGSEGGYVFAVDLTGKIKWQFQARRAVTSSPAISDDLVVVGSMDSTIYALDAGTGWAVWRFRSRRPIVSSPVIVDDTVYIGSSDGRLYALDLDSGRKLWEHETEGQIPGSPAVWEKAVYLGSTDGNIYSLDTKRGQLRWRYDTESQIIGSPTIVDGVVYFGATNHKMYALPL